MKARSAAPCCAWRTSSRRAPKGTRACSSSPSAPFGPARQRSSPRATSAATSRCCAATSPPYLFRIPDVDSRNRIERFLFWSNYKGSTDFMTKYVYPPLVWTFVHPLARWRVHPNWVTGFDWLATFATVPLFAGGAWLPGLLLAYLMSVFDSVDGKLARLTYTSSKFGEVSRPQPRHRPPAGLVHGLGLVARRRRRRVGALSGVAVAAGILRPGPGVCGRLQGAPGRIDPRVHPARREGADLHLPAKRQPGPVHGRVDRRLRSRRGIARPCTPSTSSWPGRWRASRGTPSASSGSGTPASPADAALPTSIS